MLKEMNLIQQTISKKRLYNVVKEVSSFHRIQASSGFNEASAYCLKELEKSGIEAKVLNYSADDSTWFLNNKSFMQWDLEHAFLEIEGLDLKLADTSDDVISIIQKSYPHEYFENVELVYLDKGNDPKEYEDVDLKGKIAFVRGQINGYSEWVTKDKGAIGIVTDFLMEVEGVRDRSKLYDTIGYTSFWWSHSKDEVPCFGFVLSPRMGDKLVKLVEKQKADYLSGKSDKKNLTCRGEVKTSIHNGVLQVVEAKIPGETDEEVCIAAHLCHPKSSCNDNASGVSAGIEVLRVLKELIQSNKLEKNKRTIKLILIPEFTGTYCYLSDHTDYKKCIGAINLDMVGGKQTRDYGPITLTSLPYSTPSFINDLSSLCLKYAGREAFSHEGGKVNLTNYTVSPFSGGSDHTVFSDPKIGIPCCMVGQWPDLNYHTSTDTLDVIDPNVLAFSCSMAVLYAYTLSNLNEVEFKEILLEMHVNLANTIKEFMKDVEYGVTSKDIAYNRLMHIKNFFVKGVLDVERVCEVSKETIEKEIAWIETEIMRVVNYLDVQEVHMIKRDTRVFKCLLKAPLHRFFGYYEEYPKAKELVEKFEKIGKKFGIRANGVGMLASYYIDGKRSVDEVCACVSYDMRMDVTEIIEAYLEVLLEIKLVEII